MFRNLFCWLAVCVAALWITVAVVEFHAGRVDQVDVPPPRGYVCPRCREVLRTDGAGAPYCWHCFVQLGEDDLLERVIEREQPH